MTTEARHLSAETRTSERGFTLIELSIVLVIIGLLIGGVLQGQEMINNTRLKTTVAQTDAITAAIQTFEDKYRMLPGDTTNAVAALIGATASAGDNDGLLGGAGDAVVASPAGGIANGSEAALAFNHMGTTGLLQNVDFIGLLRVNSTVPANIGNGAAFDIATFTFATGGNGLGLRIRTGTAAAPAVALNSDDMFSLDQKYDDGVGNTGRWQVNGEAACFTAGAYVAAAAPVCTPYIRIR